MAYPTVSAPYGLKAINSIDGKPYAGAIRQIPIASGYATAIFNGDTVKISGGYLVADTSTNAATPCGVLVGCSYINSSGQPVQGQYYPAAAATSTNPAFAYVIDDQQALFKVALVTAGTTTVVSSTVGARSTLVGQNIALVQNSGSTITGDSAIGATVTGAGTTATIPLRVIDVVPESAQVISGTTYYREVLVKINTHQYNNTTGV
jgi:hypothetical protein